MFASNKIIINSDLYDDAEVKIILQKAKNSKIVKATDTIQNPDIQVCNTYIVDCSEYQDIIDATIEKTRIYLEQTYNITCELSEYEFGKYEVGGNYAQHIDGQYLDGDTIKIGPIQKDMSAILYFNNDYDGGEISFPFFNKTIRPKAGQLLTFPSNWRYAHKVSKVLAGERYMLVIWFKTTPSISVEEVLDNPKYIKVLNCPT
jgi:predicted 2-oxoglutarate/Fe(II)-dependent dioxygenase YbiX